MLRLRLLLGPPERLPSISAPDLYQYFFQLSIVDAYGTRPDEEAKIDAAW